MTRKKIVIAIDTETALITPGNLAPKLVCVSWAVYSHVSDSIVTGILKEPADIKSQAMQWIKSAAEHDEVLLIGHNVSYDMAVLANACPELLPFIFAAYSRGNIQDTQIRQQLIDIASGEFWMNRRKGGYTLKALSEKHTEMRLSKGEDTWRLRYEELIDVPLKDWPNEAKEYAEKDAEVTYKVFIGQMKSPHCEGSEVPNDLEQAKAAFVLHLMACWGVVTDEQHGREFFAKTQETMNKNRRVLILSGLMREAGTKNLKEIRERVSKSLGRKAKTTKKGNVSTDEDTLLSTGDRELEALIDFSKAQKLDSVWKRYIEQGYDRKTPVQASFHCLVESGRTSCSKPNLQNPHRATGLRECFVPREGYLYVACDYATLELCTLAQVNTWLFKKCNMAKKLCEGVDLHLHFASQMLGISYGEASLRFKAGDKEVKKSRQIAKVANFGYPGGMGAKGLSKFAKGYGQDISVEQAESLRDAWFRAWPEMKDFFKFVSLVVGQEKGTIKQFLTERVRGQVTFTQACNSFFQGLAADGAKAALFEVSRRCYTEPESKLYASRPVMFIHDEIIIEAPETSASDAADELAAVMRFEMKKFTPSVPIKTTVAMMDRWYKDAEEVRDGNGKLIKWTPTLDD